MKDQSFSTTKVIYPESNPLPYNRINLTGFLQRFSIVAFIFKFLKNHLALVFLLPFSFLLVFTGLDDTVLQVDEGSDTFISTTILKYGYPKHSDGSHYTMPEGDAFDGIFLYRTWVPYYLQSASLLLFGQSTYSARLPFAILGFLSIWSLYSFTLQLTQRKSIAFLASMLLATSIPALLYFRTARYVAIPILLTPLLLRYYIPIFNKEKWNPLPLTLISIIYFHTMYVEFAGVILGMLAHLFIYRNRVTSNNLAKVKLSAIITALLCLPWLTIIPALMSKLSEYYTSASPLVDTTLWRFPKHFFAFLFQINNYIFPFILAPFIFILFSKQQRFQVSLLSLCSISVLITATLHSIPLMQYIAACIPMLYILLAMIVFHIFEKSVARQSIFMLALIVTNFIHVGPLLPIKKLALHFPDKFETTDYSYYAYQTFLREVNLKSTFYLYWQELAHRYQGPLDELIRFFDAHGKKGETCYIDNASDTMVLLTKLKMINEKDLDNTSKPDWIVLRGNQRAPQLNKPALRSRKILNTILATHNYEKIVLNAPVKRVNNSYDIQLHRFLSPTSSEKVHVYRRIVEKQGQS
jgi:4-amino-4-deoxy-L-arabinose transferase-like glycosyltransferase